MLIPEEWPSIAATRGQNPAYRPSDALSLRCGARAHTCKHGLRDSRCGRSDGHDTQNDLTMSGFDIARKHFQAALAEAREQKMGEDAIARYLLNLVVSKYLETRPVKDVQSELRFVADNCDPDTDFEFMRP